MMRFLQGLGAAVVALLAVLPAIAGAQNISASTLYLEQTETQFSLNIPNDTSGDVFIYFTSPAYSWVGVGFGEEMKNSLMFIMYPSQNGNNVTVSTRIANGHSEPSHYADANLEILSGTGIDDEMFVLKAVCHNCRVWHNGFIDVKNTAHPMIYAFGPGNALQSNSLNAPLKRHVRYGKFTMDMEAARGTGGVPAATSAANGVELQGGMRRDHDRANLAHAVIGCLAIFVLWPLNVIIAGFFRNIKIHVGMSVSILVFLIIAFALGISTSYEYNRSKSFTSGHQILAFIALLPILAISLLPLRPLSALSPLIPRLHTCLVTLTLVTLTITGGLGLHLSSQSRPIIIAYAAVSLVVVCFSTLLQTCIKRRGSAYARHTTRQRLGEEDEQDLVLAAFYANRKLEGGESRSESEASLRPTAGVAGAGHERSPSAGSAKNIYGGGTMPGPQYLLNMHPGVPVHRW
ncbi:CBD9-like protein [Polyplosphaeria fusca]|uniref:CBD9-like protein n=1 Tax=Polyplosphaeria fusca TaxID=682080 RepID=A0A9P4QU22_9PLEO|nr:CBD9-like protein [Polyplosphaeria fusca]